MIDKKVIELVTEIVTKCVECNKAEQTEEVIFFKDLKIKQFPKKRQAPTVFSEFNGHVNSLNIRVFENGWEEGAKPYGDFIKIVYLDGEIDDTICELNEILAYLKKLEDNYEKDEKDT